MKATIIVCTRDRRASCLRTLESLLSDPALLLQGDCEIVVVDQSPGAGTGEAIGGLPVRHLSSSTRGLSAARNHGASVALGDLLLFTDDDCLVDAGWKDAWCRAFATHPGAGIGFGQVSCPPFDPARGYTAGFNVRAGTHGIELFRLGAGQVGMGANMALPRRVWQQLGGFDEGLGAGARFVSAEDSDFAYRAARAGYRILHLREARVWHHGYREGAGASRLMRGYVAGIGAMYAKHARCGDPVAIRLLATDLAHHVANVSRRLPARARPLGLGGLLFYLRGILASWRCRVDRARRLYAA